MNGNCGIRMVPGSSFRNCCQFIISNHVHMMSKIKSVFSKKKC